MDDIMTIKEVAEKLKVSDRTVRNWIESGKLSAYRFGLQYRITKASFDEFIKKSEVKGE